MISSKPVFLFLSIFVTFTLCCRQQPVFSQKIKVYDLVEDFKAVADDKTDCYPAFVRAAKALSNTTGAQLNIPTGRYYIASYKITGGAQKNGIDDIIFKNCKNLIITGNNSEIRMNGKFWRNRDTQIPGLPYLYAYNNTVVPFKFNNCKNVLLKDIQLYGEVDKMKKQKGVVEAESYGVYISDDEPEDESSNIVLRNIKAHHFATDGFVIKSNGEDIEMNGCRSYNNARQGLSIVKGKNIRILNSIFDSTGSTGAYGWHAPGAGIDVENEFGEGKLSNVLIRNCMLRGNNGFQIVTTMLSDHVVIDSCFISDRTSGYSDALNGVGMYSTNSTLSNCILFAGIQVDLSDQIYKGPAVQEINKNIIYSGDRCIVSSDFSRPVNITDNIIVMLPKPKLDAYSPYIQNPNCVFNRNIILIHGDRLKKDPGKITALVMNVKESLDNFWLINNYAEPAAKQGKVSFYTAMSDSKKVKNQFYSPGAMIYSTEVANTSALSAIQVKELLAKELFTAYGQTVYNGKYMEQANAVRAYAKRIVDDGVK